MATFNDKTGRAWTLAIDIAAMRRVRAKLNINLADCIVLGKTAGDDRPLLETLASDPVLLVDLLCALCERECQERGVTDEAFAAIFDGPAIDAASLALLEALDDFFRNPASQLVLRMATRAKQKWPPANPAMTDLDGLIDAALEAAAANLYGGSSLPPRASPDSTLDLAPSAN